MEKLLGEGFTSADIATIAVRHEINDDLAVRQVVRYGKTVNDYLVTNPGDGGAAHTDIVRLLLEAGAKPTIADRDGVTPLRHADFATAATAASRR